ncbi:beta-TrCP-like [Eriocheir sinensis]|uniref:beta-TrCP-like n=1 Tax=Eriocheir sinensis TaxID=95602 RepID=UPI0021C7F00E|nr:beta-TrCP-like [Eriocheir sinensis]XP_050709267.1 beta-TrCP-like [Eriocheir sinensis]XP_050709270.1 beta-TrCP-like [Eriocheir sinensis]XP_050709277.1 beta-TrCP-like [Eriocheir sinensis]XP_050709285.1 beta-TrCP-like [Eriocheir sinensis]XP_050709291.1 beta-TrCP-like [Eriocheir sinensis]XP_050709298.1 beta-TrCP-like [Eriocheir sinensis]XP_050709304.1 beta-TrCP-like [Eriocheir sinensis]XP_050709310.1 beta-TrCP-like [Eriocheir sinensis]XP_050709314.1 beta-TrCP-like [Eriocheir sinensis]XP_05
MDLSPDLGPSSQQLTRSGSHARSLSVSDLSLASPMPETVNEAIVNGTYDRNLNKEMAINRNNASAVVCWSELPRKSYSLPHRYKAHIIGGWRGLPREYADRPPAPQVSPSEFKHHFTLMRQWFNRFTDEQKNRVLAELLEHIGPSQLHLLSVAIGSRLHHGCPPNCEDPIGWLPVGLGLTVFSYLDPVSLAQASQVCKAWHSLASQDCLWRSLSLQREWQLTPSSHLKQLSRCTLQDGSVDWKQVFVERYRLHRNWLGAHCHVRTFEGHTEGVSCVQFDDHRIVSGSHDNTIKVWNMRTNSRWSVQTLVGHSNMVRCLHLAGNRLVSGSADATIKVWDVEETSQWSSINCKVTMIGHSSTVRCLQVVGERVVSGSYDHLVKVWALASGECLRTLAGHQEPVLTVAFDDDKIISGAADKTIKVWQLESGRCQKTLVGHEDGVTTLTYDQTTIISGSLDCTIRLWSLATGQCVGVLDWMSSEGHTGVIRCLAADSRRIVSASDDKTIKVWDRDSRRRLVTLRNHTDGVTCLAFNDHVIVSGSYDKTVKLWDFSVC